MDVLPYIIFNILGVVKKTKIWTKGAHFPTLPASTAKCSQARVTSPRFNYINVTRTNAHLIPSLALAPPPIKAPNMCSFSILGKQVSFGAYTLVL